MRNRVLVKGGTWERTFFARANKRHGRRIASQKQRGNRRQGSLHMDSELRNKRRRRINMKNLKDQGQRQSAGLLSIPDYLSYIRELSLDSGYEPTHRFRYPGQREGCEGDQVWKMIDIRER